MPLLVIFMPDKVLWELLVRVLVCKRIIVICCEKSCEHTLFAFSTLKHTVKSFGRVKYHEVVTRQMDLQAYDGWILVTNRELEKAPSSLCCSNVTTVFEFSYFVLTTVLNLDRSSVRSLVCVFSDVFRSCQRHDTFHIYVGIVPACER